jgi:hypothetical protein
MTTALSRCLQEEAAAIAAAAQRLDPSRWKQPSHCWTPAATTALNWL